MRRAPEIRIEPLVGAVVGGGTHDDVTEAILDAAAEVLAASGLRGCTVEEVAARARVGRTTIYRRFEGRDDLVHAVLAREVRRAFAAVAAAVAHLDRPEDRLVEGILAALDGARLSPLVDLVRDEPELLRLVTVESGPLIDVAVSFLVEEGERSHGRLPSERDRHTAEMLVRFGVSLLLTPQGTLPLDDRDAARTALHALLDPLLQADG
jgi:AcrR family transcriptional regulator